MRRWILKNQRGSVLELQSNKKNRFKLNWSNGGDNLPLAVFNMEEASVLEGLPKTLVVVVEPDSDVDPSPKLDIAKRLIPQCRSYRNSPNVQEKRDQTMRSQV